MATHSRVLAWRIPEMGEPGGLLSGVAQSRTRLKRHSSSSIYILLHTPHLFIPLSINGYLGCLYLLAILNNAAMNMGVQISLCDPAFNVFGRIPRSGIAGSYGNFIFNFLRNYHAVSHIICTILYSYQDLQLEIGTTSSLTFVILWLLLLFF